MQSRGKSPRFRRDFDPDQHAIAKFSNFMRWIQSFHPNPISSSDTFKFFWSAPCNFRYGEDNFVGDWLQVSRFRAYQLGHHIFAV